VPDAKSLRAYSAVRLVLLVLLAITLSWKVAVYLGHSGDSQGLAYRKMAEFLARQHFSVTMDDKPADVPIAIRAVAGACRLLIANSPPNGSDRARIGSYATPADTVFVVYRGRMYAEQPVWVTMAHSIWSKFLRELGFRAQVTPAFVVIATRGCGAEQLPWPDAV
jgi:hypothetical protein